ncbi:MAG TPA: hypothetical protein VFP55_07810 [Solirubrobacteraceae bacterium]|nr:hypothetical protein [Solirubrobacteraceae bacterium]
MRRAAALVVLLVAVLVLGVGQLVLPGLAASTLRDRLAGSGRVLSVNVSAFPAIELLWHSADRVVVRMASYRSPVSHLNSLLQDSRGVGTLVASVGVLRSGLLTLHDVTLTKQGSRLTGSGTLLESDLQASVPFLRSVRLVSATSDSVTVAGTASALGVSATVPATIRPEQGRLVVVPDLPLGGFATVTVFSEPHVSVDGVGGRPIPGGIEMTARARFT